MRQIIVLVLVAASLSAFCAEPAPQFLLAEYVRQPESPGDVFFQSRKFDQFDYRGALRSAAANDRTGLRTLLQYSGGTTLIGEGAEDHASILSALLDIWGDARFSEVLQSCSPEAVTSVHGFLEYAGVSREQFPRTFAAVGER